MYLKPRFHPAMGHGVRHRPPTTRQAIMPRDPKPLRLLAFASFAISIATLLGVLGALVVQAAS